MHHRRPVATLVLVLRKFPPGVGIQMRRPLRPAGFPNPLWGRDKRSFGLRGSLGRDEDDTRATMARAKARGIVKKAENHTGWCTAWCTASVQEHQAAPRATERAEASVLRRREGRVSGVLQRWSVCGRCAACCLHCVDDALCSVSKMGARCASANDFGSVHVPSRRAIVRRSERTWYAKGAAADVGGRHC